MHDYTSADITVLTFADAIRKRPGMYFGVGPGDPRLASRVLCAVVGHAFHPAARVARSHTPRVVADITGDLAFSVTDDMVEALTGPHVPRLGYEDSLLGVERWSSAAAAVVSSQTIVEVWQGGRGFRQTLVGLRPTGPPTPFPAPEGAGTKVAHVLDPAFFGSAVISTDIAALDIHGPDCTGATGPGRVVVRDHRVENGPAEHRLA